MTGAIAPMLAALAAGRISARQLLAAAGSAIAAGDAPIGAIRRRDPAAPAAAARCDDFFARTGRLLGPLHGIPLVVKDNIDCRGLPTSSGAASLAAAMPRRDAAMVARLRRAGAVILAKTNLSEFSFEIRSRSTLGGDVRHPRNPAITAGGSSGGTAAAIAAGFALGGLGTDTGGSIRIPASFCGLYGLRPTHGRLSLAGVAPLAPSADTIGPMAGTAQDLALLFAVLAENPSPLQPILAGRRIGVLRQAFGQDREILAATSQALAVLAAAGAVLVDPIPPIPGLPPASTPHCVDLEFAPAFDAYLARNFQPGTAPPNLAALLGQGRVLPDLAAALAFRLTPDRAALPRLRLSHAALRRAIAAAFDAAALDALIYPSSAAVPNGLDNPPSGWAAEIAARSGWPALVQPIGRAANRTAIGLEWLGRPGCEITLLGMADALSARFGGQWDGAIPFALP